MIRLRLLGRDFGRAGFTLAGTQPSPLATAPGDTFEVPEAVAQRILDTHPHLFERAAPAHAGGSGLPAEQAEGGGAARSSQPEPEPDPVLSGLLGESFPKQLAEIEKLGVSTRSGLLAKGRDWLISKVPGVGPATAAKILAALG